ncbi:TonB-dependent siderophore receptor [Pseudomonas sp. ABC1]|uniref:TonB-dependent siderophore receptor n=1 Tax=Pseudomonas sp. ABC1 TaxID=2748080 RepID=UPI0015C3C8BD|nr:TonB-dependent receptor [Pseudomonas sp. ABC1]QLF93484.1 TonB-dependent siderophore receptor [Pseudomonas sp. ABC1]
MHDQPTRSLRRAIAFATLLGCTLPALAAEQPARFDIPAQPLDSALTRFADQAGLRILFTSDDVAGLDGNPLNGSFPPSQALQRLLQGSGYGFQFVDEKTLTLRKLQEGSGPVELDATRIDSSATPRLMSEGSGSYASTAASIMKGARSLKEIPQSVTVMTRKRLDDQRLDTVTEALANTPGIVLIRRPNGGSDIYARGYLTESLQYDGVPMLRYHNWGNSLSASAVHLDRIEVLRGASGLLEGAGHPAGSVNLVRKRGLADNALSLEARAGSWDTYGTRIDTGGPLNETGTLRSRIVVDYQDGHSFLDSVWDKDANAYAALDLDVSPNTVIGLGFSYARLNGNSALYSGVPRYADGRSLGLSRSAYLSPGWNEATRREKQTFIDLEHRLNADWSFKSTAVFIQESYDAIESHANGLVALGGNTVSGPGFDYSDSAKSHGLDMNLTGNLQLFGLAHDLVLGGNYSRQERDDGYSQYWGYATYNVFDPRHNPPRLEQSTPTAILEQDTDTEQRGLYGMLRSHLTDKLTLNLGARVSWYAFDSETTILNAASTSRSSLEENGEFTPYAGLVYALTPQWSAYASYTEIFSPQTSTDAQFRILPPMTGIAYETGVKGEHFDGDLNTSLAIYRVDQKDRAVTDYDAPMVCDGWYCSRAAGKVRSEGFELEAHGKLTQGLQVSAGYTYNRNRYLQDTDKALEGKPFDYGPRHVLRLWSDYQLPGDQGKWRVGAGVNFRSEQKTNSTTRLNPVQGSYAIWNAMLAYRIDGHWSTQLNMNNVFDKKYYSNISDNYFYSHVGEPRNFTVSLRGEF